MAPSVDVVGRADRRAVARSRSHFARHRGRCLLRRREPPRRQGPGQDPLLSRRRPRPLAHRRDAKDTGGFGSAFSPCSQSLCGAFIGPHMELFMQVPNTYRGGPDERGRFGIYGGRFVAETLMPLILAVEAAYTAARKDPGFRAELDYYLEHYVGRPSPLYFAERLTRHFGGAKLYLKRDELNHTGAHKI